VVGTNLLIAGRRTEATDAITYSGYTIHYGFFCSITQLNVIYDKSNLTAITTWLMQLTYKGLKSMHTSIYSFKSQLLGYLTKYASTHKYTYFRS